MSVAILDEPSVKSPFPKDKIPSGYYGGGGEYLLSDSDDIIININIPEEVYNSIILVSKMKHKRPFQIINEAVSVYYKLQKYLEENKEHNPQIALVRKEKNEGYYFSNSDLAEYISKISNAGNIEKLPYKVGYYSYKAFGSDISNIRDEVSKALHFYHYVYENQQYLPAVICEDNDEKKAKVFNVSFEANTRNYSRS